MKIINLLYQKYLLSLFVCFSSCLAVFFIFSLISSLNENFTFDLILNISFLNSLQILLHVPSFIYLLSIILLTIFLKSKNEITIIKSYLNLNKLILCILPIVIIFTYIELNKSKLNILIEDFKSKLLDSDNNSEIKIFVRQNKDYRNYTILKNIDLENLNKAEYRSYIVKDRVIKNAEFSNNLTYLNNSFYANSYTQYKNSLIENINSKKIININLTDLFKKNSITQLNSKKNKFASNLRLINLSSFFLLFFTYIFLFFFNTKFINTKQSLKYPTLICLFILIYSFLIFNNSLTFYRQEYELLASILVAMFFLKVYFNE